MNNINLHCFTPHINRHTYNEMKEKGLHKNLHLKYAVNSEN